MEKIKRIEIPEKLFKELVDHAIKSSPYESVSIISGRITKNIAIAEKVYTPENIDKSTISFTVEPITLLKIYTDIEKEKKIIIGIYHTHPAPPSPSGTDRKYMEVNPYVWLISSTSTPERPKGYFLTENDIIKEIAVKIIK